MPGRALTENQLGVGILFISKISLQTLLFQVRLHANDLLPENFMLSWVNNS